jgi:Uncharacterised protein conserved in bacteria (DUF2336)
VSEDDLAELAEMRDLEHLLAIGSRSDLSEYLTTTLIMRGYSAIHTLIARNSSARLSEAGFSVLLKIAERDIELATSLGARSDIPYGPLRKYLAMVEEKPRAAFLHASPVSVKTLAQRGVSQLPIPDRDYSSAERQITELRRRGKLNDSAINRFAIMQEFDSGQIDLLVIACNASRIRWATTVSVLKSRENCLPLREGELKALNALFESVSLSEAQRTVRFGPAAKQ